MVVAGQIGETVENDDSACCTLPHFLLFLPNDFFFYSMLLKTQGGGLLRAACKYDNSFKWTRYGWHHTFFSSLRPALKKGSLISLHNLYSTISCPLMFMSQHWNYLSDFCVLSFSALRTEWWFKAKRLSRWSIRIHAETRWVLILFSHTTI